METQKHGWPETTLCSALVSMVYIRNNHRKTNTRLVIKTTRAVLTNPHRTGSKLQMSGGNFRHLSCVIFCLRNRNPITMITKLTQVGSRYRNSGVITLLHGPLQSSITSTNVDKSKHN